MKKLVVIGSGIGGISAVYELKDLVGDQHEILLVSDSESFEFTPSNPWVAVKWRTADAITVPLAPVMEKHGIGFLHDAVQRVQPESNSLLLDSGKTVNYDYLVLATGPHLAFEEIEGLGPQGFTSSVCKTTHAVSASADFEALCKNPGPVVIGAAQGASCYGPAYEYAFILETELRKRKIRHRVPMTFVTPEPYVGHLGLDGVGDTKGLLESELRSRHIKWLCNTRIDSVEDGLMHVSTVDEQGKTESSDSLKFAHSMILPAFTGVSAVLGIDQLVNPRGFIIVDEFQRNPTWPNIYAVGVCVAIPPVGKSALPVGVPKTGYMIESMVTAAVGNIALALAGQAPEHRATWNAFCLADFGDRGVAFLALPQIPPRNTNWAAAGKWVHLAKVAFEKYYLRKVRKGSTEPYYEKLALKLIGAAKLRGEA